MLTAVAIATATTGLTTGVAVDIALHLTTGVTIEVVDVIGASLPFTAYRSRAILIRFARNTGCDAESIHDTVELLQTGTYGGKALSQSRRPSRLPAARARELQWQARLMINECQPTMAHESFLHAMVPASSGSSSRVPDVRVRLDAWLLPTHDRR